jgi:hypothetical protein
MVVLLVQIGIFVKKKNQKSLHRPMNLLPGWHEPRYCEKLFLESPCGRVFVDSPGGRLGCLGAFAITELSKSHTEELAHPF